MLRSNSRSQGNPWNPEEDQTTAFSAMLYSGLLHTRLHSCPFWRYRDSSFNFAKALIFLNHYQYNIYTVSQ